MKRMHYLLLQEQKPAAKAEVRGLKKKKKSLKNSKGEWVGGDFFSLPAVIPLVDPVAHSKHNISRDKRPWKRNW